MKRAVVTYGRMNPPTAGHEKLIRKVHQVAEMSAADAFVFTSHKHDSRNPLLQEQKIQYLKKISPAGVNISGSSVVQPSIWHQLSKLHLEGYRHVTFVAGSDRIQEFSERLNKYNGVAGSHGFYDFNKIEVVSSGSRDADSSGIEGISGTKMRNLAAENNIQEFTKGLPDKLKPLAEAIMQHVTNWEDEDNYDFTDGELQEIVNGMSVEDIDDEEYDDELYEAPLTERIMTIAQRRTAGRRMRRVHHKYVRLRKVKSKRMAPHDRLHLRSRRAALTAVRGRVAGKRGANYNKLSPQEKIAVDKIVQKKQNQVGVISKRMLPMIRKKEITRLAKARGRSTNEEINMTSINEARPPIEDGENAREHIVMQLRKVTNGAKKEVHFDDNKKHPVSIPHARKALQMHDGIKQPQHRADFASKMSGSHSGLMGAVSGKVNEMKSPDHSVSNKTIAGAMKGGKGKGLGLKVPSQEKAAAWIKRNPDKVTKSETKSFEDIRSNGLNESFEDFLEGDGTPGMMNDTRKKAKLPGEMSYATERREAALANRAKQNDMTEDDMNELFNILYVEAVLTLDEDGALTPEQAAFDIINHLDEQEGMVQSYGKYRDARKMARAAPQGSAAERMYTAKAEKHRTDNIGHAKKAMANGYNDKAKYAREAFDIGTDESRIRASNDTPGQDEDIKLAFDYVQKPEIARSASSVVRERMEAAKMKPVTEGINHNEMYFKAAAKDAKTKKSSHSVVHDKGKHTMVHRVGNTDHGFASNEYFGKHPSGHSHTNIESRDLRTHNTVQVYHNVAGQNPHLDDSCVRSATKAILKHGKDTYK